ncbi:hypothetical protein PFICI_00827 [Pestalotiopsis fici W106-1]|uniref:Uncharacterized protein n=1 Tax=Pestalotiopsis fici (strain W106-1 / CGMCC3.15140) TaxID=1229662 RepID=W3XLX4_PESFW|nr:uncharacterized protein PFICI_00827 [Pestalotiopsis fici W106-1]ETS86999.1 hypothetical protein PFICI_00827 [Pestalotiopsis fici W106-1]
MQSLIIFALALLPTAIGAPTEKRVLGDVELFTEENFAGQSETLFVGDTSDWIANCKKLPEPYALNLGSFRPSSGLLCRLYSSEYPDCSGHGMIIADGSDASGATLFTLANPESQTGGFVGQDAESISCVRCTNCV